MNPRFLLVFLLLVLPIACAQGMGVERTHADSVELGDALTVSIRVSNSGSEDAHVLVKEPTSSYFEFIDKQPVSEQWEGLRVMFLEWRIVVPVGGEETLTYKIRPKELGDYSISPTAVLDDATVLAEGAPSRFVAVCKPDGVCDTAAFEDYLTCPDDCTTGIEDEMCDFKEDGRCDPDCDPGYDPDCLPEQPAAAPSEPGVEVYAAVILVIIIAAAVAVFLIRRRPAGVVE